MSVTKGRSFKVELWVEGEVPAPRRDTAQSPVPAPRAAVAGFGLPLPSHVLEAQR